MRIESTDRLNVCLELFPMVMCLDEKGNVLFASDKLVEKVGDILGKSLFELFSVSWPTRSLPDWDGLTSNHEGALLLLESDDLRFGLRGQLIADIAQGQNVFLFVGSPWLSWLDGHPDSRRVSVDDFPIIDNQLEYQMGLATQKSMLADMEWFSAGLLDAKLQAEAANQAKTHFVRHITHEIRTPLNGIISSLNMLTRENIDEAQKQRLIEIAENCSNALIYLVNEVLDFSQIEANKFASSIAEFSVLRLLRETVGALGARIEEKQITVEIESDIEIEQQVRTDRKIVLKVLFNLIGNAIKHSGSDKITIRLAIESDDQSDRALTIEIEDYGIGIGEDDLRELFEPFATARDSDPNADSTGLGLYITRQVVGGLGGQIEVSSTLGEGSRFRVTIPIEMADSLEQGSEEVDNMADRPARYSGHVLLAEDNAINLELAVLQLTGLGLTVITAETGEQAVKREQLYDFDLILMDVSMPEMDGVDATLRIRKDGRNREIPIIAFTANVSAHDLKEYLSAGMNDVLTKPVDKKNLVRICEAYLNSSSDLKGSPADGESGPSSALLNSERANLLVNEVGVENIPRIIRRFIEANGQALQELADAARVEDWEAVARISHRTASSSLSVGLDRLGYRLREIEKSTRNGGFLATAEIEELETLYQDSIEKLSQLL
jgi:signal transduction histidine kinase/CheY-like chemotaxis protein